MNLKEKIADGIILLSIFWFLLTFFTPDLMLSKTTTTGGDMGSHYVLAHYLKNYLVPHGKLIGWYPHWLAGTPMFQYYFIPPYLLIAILSYFIPLEIAFKLVTVLGIFLLPVLTYLSMRIIGFKFPVPIISASFSLLFLFIETYSQYGGNIKSTLAGQFPHGISFALTFFLIALVYKGMRNGKYLTLSSITMSLVILTHIYTTISVLFTFLLFSIESIIQKKFERIFYIIFVCLIAFLLSGFWLLPMISKLGFSSAPKDIFFGFPDISQAILQNFLIFYLLALFCIFSPIVDSFIQIISKRKLPDLKIGSIINMDGKLSGVYYYLLSAVILFMISNHTNLLYVRFLPILYFLPLILAAIGIRKLTEIVRIKSVPMLILAFIVTLSVMGWLNTGVNEIYIPGSSYKIADFTKVPWLNHGVKDIPFWIKWNYEGLESKPNWGTYRELNDYLRDHVTSGRVDIEYGDYNRYGTPRVFEASPIFSNKSVMESLLLESSLTFPFFYYLQKESSADSWWPGFPLDIPGFNPDRAAKDLRLYNVRYFVASSDKVKTALADNPNYKFMARIKEFDIYQLNEDSQYVEPLRKEPILVITDDWRKFAFKWMALDYKDVPLVFSSKITDYELKHFRLVVLDKKENLGNNGNLEIFNSSDFINALNASNDIESDCKVYEDVREEEILIRTNCIEKPLIVKTTYFPNWQAEGARRIYLASPSVMLIFPEQEDVRIYYGTLPSDIIGDIFTIIGLIIVIYLIFRGGKNFSDHIYTKITGPLIKYRLLELINEKISTFIKFLFKQKYRLIALLLAALIVYAVFDYIQKQNECASYCRSDGSFKGEIPYQKVEEYNLGSAHKGENLRHNLVCTGLCDEGRKDMVYIPFGYVQFDMRVEPGVKNKLILRLWDNANCRSGNLIINGKFLTTIKGNGTFNWHDFEFEIPQGDIETDKMQMKLEFDNAGCYGWDLSKAVVMVPGCRC